MTTLLNTAQGLIRSFVGADPLVEMGVEKCPKVPGLFAQCSFAIIRSATLTSEEAENVSEHWKQNPRHN